MHSFCAKSSEFPKFHPKYENIEDLLLMELWGLLEQMELMEHLELISLDHDHKQKNNGKNIYIVLAVYQKFYEVWLILYLFLPNEKKEFLNLLAERVKLYGKISLKYRVDYITNYITNILLLLTSCR